MYNASMQIKERDGSLKVREAVAQREIIKYISRRNVDFEMDFLYSSIPRNIRPNSHIHQLVTRNDPLCGDRVGCLSWDYYSYPHPPHLLFHITTLFWAGVKWNQPVGYICDLRPAFLRRAQLPECVLKHFNLTRKRVQLKWLNFQIWI